MPTMEQLGSSSEVTVSKPDAQESLNLPSPRQRQQSQVGNNVSRQTQDSRVLKLKGKNQTSGSRALPRRLTSIPATVLGRWLVSLMLCVLMGLCCRPALFHKREGHHRFLWGGLQCYGGRVCV
jgi:hypothetical protein